MSSCTESRFVEEELGEGVLRRELRGVGRAEKSLPSIVGEARCEVECGIEVSGWSLIRIGGGKEVRHIVHV